MLKFLSYLSPKKRVEIADARTLYANIMTQSRNPDFFTNPSKSSSAGLAKDDFDGRMEILCLHLSVVNHRLSQLGGDGQILSQALYDVMVDDFDVALREECLADTGVSRRIKPMAKMYLTRAKLYADALNSGNILAAISVVIQKYIIHAENASETQAKALASYTQAFSASLAALGLDEISTGKLVYPKF